MPEGAGRRPATTRRHRGGHHGGGGAGRRGSAAEPRPDAGGLVGAGGGGRPPRGRGNEGGPLKLETVGAIMLLSAGPPVRPSRGVPPGQGKGPRGPDTPTPDPGPSQQ